MSDNKFFEFTQNNSGGSFSVDKELCHRVVIEAESAEEANNIASGMGIYFDGCDAGHDCPCCGDRWYSVDDSDGDTFPYTDFGERTFQDEVEYYQYLADTYGWTKPDCRIFYKDGKVTEIFSKRITK